MFNFKIIQLILIIILRSTLFIQALKQLSNLESTLLNHTTNSSSLNWDNISILEKTIVSQVEIFIYF
jgi:hypothetical protein